MRECRLESSIASMYPEFPGRLLVTRVNRTFAGIGILVLLFVLL